jgi:hypothetical protein
MTPVTSDTDLTARLAEALRDNEPPRRVPQGAVSEADLAQLLERLGPVPRSRDAQRQLLRVRQPASG